MRDSTLYIGALASNNVNNIVNDAEELKEKAKDGYTSSSKIGKYGLERAYESTLRAVNGSVNFQTAISLLYGQVA